jgi:translation initiation factor IF-1
MAKNETVIEARGQVVTSYPNATFDVKLDDTGTIIKAGLAGKLRRYYTRITIGDFVKIKLSPYDNLQKGVIVYREK